MKKIAQTCLISLLMTIAVSHAQAPEGMIIVPGGTNSGTDPEKAYYLTVSTFYMDSTEVTKAKWDVVRSWAITNGYQFDNAGQGKSTNHPVHSVSWYDSLKWCNARSEMEGRTPCYTVSGLIYRSGQFVPVSAAGNNGFRLPTETEWKYAFRGGQVGLRFPWGNTVTHSNANYHSDTYFYGAYDKNTYRNFHPAYTNGARPYTSPVKSFAPNDYGLYDMVGNVWEWCWFYNSSGCGRLGGSWYSVVSNSRGSSTMNWSHPLSAGLTIGFRTVCRD